jgi:AraC family transcriptional regulator
MTVSPDTPTGAQALRLEIGLQVDQLARRPQGLLLREPLVVSDPGRRRSSAWLHRVLTLLEAAIHQLRHQQEAHAQILMATSLLRQQTYPESTQDGAAGNGRLLAWQVRKVLEYIDAHLATRILLADLCALVERSQAHFSRTFKQTFGESPHAFVVRRRLELATHYMMHTHAPLGDIALQCGFADQAHFTKRFTLAMGQTPAAWRRAHSASVSSKIIGADDTVVIFGGSVVGLRRLRGTSYDRGCCAAGMTAMCR